MSTPTVTVTRPLHVRAASAEPRDPGPGVLARLLALLTAAGLSIPKKAADAATEAERLSAETARIGGDRTLARPERAHRRDQLRAEAARARTRAVTELAAQGAKLEAAAARLVAAAAARITAALAELPEQVRDAEQAMAAGPDVAARWATVAADDVVVRQLWGALDALRAAGALPSPLTRRDLNPAASDLGVVLTPPGEHRGAYYVPVAHRCARPWLIATSTTASQMIRASLAPTVIGAEQARTSLLTHAAAVVRGEAARCGGWNG